MKFHDESRFENALNKLGNVNKQESQLNEVLMYNEKLVQIKITPRSIAFTPFQARLDNFESNIKSRSRLIELIRNRMRIHHANGLSRWFAKNVMNNKLKYLRITRSDYYGIIPSSPLINQI